MAYQRVYAYQVKVNGVRRMGGTMHADTMDEAVRRIMSRDGLTVARKAPVFRLCDGAMVPQAEWMFEGAKAEVCVWAPAAYFC